MATSQISKTQLWQMDVTELKNALEARGLDQTGLKPILRDRLRAFIYPDDLSQTNPMNVTSATDDLNDAGQVILLKFSQGRVYQRIPKASRLLQTANISAV